jgi:hypothetical protein
MDERDLQVFLRDSLVQGWTTRSRTRTTLIRAFTRHARVRTAQQL